MTQPIIKIENISKKYNIGHKEAYYSLRDQIAGLFSGQKEKQNEEFWALKDINLEIEQGDTIGIIGRNGAGKSTLLKILSQITPPTTGKITMGGRVASLLEVGTGFNPELTGRENIFLNGAILGMTRKEIARKFDEIVAFSEIEKFLDTPVKRYSSGMYVRLAFAVAAHLEPEILIVDEVLAVGDAQFQKKCLGKMSEVGKSGRTVIFVSHNMAAINELCSKSVLLHKGKMVNFGNTTDIISEYLKSQNFNSEGSIELDGHKLRRNSMDNSNFKFTKIEILNSKGENTSSIGLREPFKLVIHGVINKKTDDLRIGFSFDSSLGFSIFNSHMTKDELDLPETGENKIIIDFKQNILGPGQYTIGLGANGENTVDWIPEAANLSIEQISLDGENVKSNFDGIILYPCEWSSTK
jgi:lipopolysaccharide transport system ATP-binding protein